MLIWTIVGAVMFWSYLSVEVSCGNGIRIYMNANLEILLALYIAMPLIPMCASYVDSV
jgi:hypothetical protein